MNTISLSKLPPKGSSLVVVIISKVNFKSSRLVTLTLSPPLRERSSLKCFLPSWVVY